MKADLTNGTEIRAIGMSRSGNHFIINWILQQLGGRFCFLNCAEGKTNPYASARPLDDGATYLTNIPGFDLEREKRGHHAPKDWLIHSYEDSFLAHACSRVFDEEHDRFVGRSGRRVDLLVVRDPYNLFASRARLGTALPPQAATRIWKQHAKAFLGRSPHLRRETVRVSYNAFVRSRRYRREVAGALGLDFSDRGIERVARCGGGSSFDGRAFDGQASCMRVLERWREFAGDPEFRTLLDPELRALAGRIFPDEALPHGRDWTPRAAEPAAPARRLAEAAS